MQRRERKVPGSEDVIETLETEEQIVEAELKIAAERREREMAKWNPKTKLGKLVKTGEITSMEQIFTKNLQILEPEIVDFLNPDMEEKVLFTRKTAYVRKSGRKFNFTALVLISDRNRLIGVGLGTDRERLPAMRKATRNAKLGLVMYNKGCGSWECSCSAPHSVPFEVKGDCGSVKVFLMPAPKGTGLVVGDAIKEVIEMAGIKDVWSRTAGSTDTKMNFIRAVVDALRKTNKARVSDEFERKMTRTGGL